MFTGLIQDIGKVTFVEQGEHCSKICIATTLPKSQGASTGDSIAVNGVCLTITHLELDHFMADVVPSTLEKTSFKNLKTDDAVNLELALRAKDFLGGHLVLGHVNDTAKVLNLQKFDESYLLTLELNPELMRYCVLEGSITLDGISLTIAQIDKNNITINIIPHTWQNTIVQFYKPGVLLNVEIDMIAKYMEKWLAPWMKQLKL